MFRGLIFAGAAAFLGASGAHATAFVFTTGATYTNNFDALLAPGAAATLPPGFTFTETGANANGAYAIGTGSSNAGDTYSFGATGSTDRALGTLRSGNLIPTIFADFTNGTGNTIVGLTIAYTGEMYRLGATGGRTDRLDFAYSVAGGAFTDLDSLDFATPNTAGAVGVRDGNAAAYRTALSATIGDLSILGGQSFQFRFSDFDASGADDGLAIDDFSLTPIFAAPPPAVPEPATWGMMLLGFSVVGSMLRRRGVLAIA